MKKISAVILAALFVVTAVSALFPVSVGAAGGDAPTLVHEPATKTVKPGSTVVLKTEASGSGLSFGWLIEDGYSGKVFDLSKAAGIKAFEALDGKGKMKVKGIKEYNSGSGNMTSELTIENIVDNNYGIIASCTVANDYGYKETDPAYIYCSEYAPEAPEIEMIAELDVRIGKLIKLACNVYPADENYVDIEYNWYETPTGKKEDATLIQDENYSVLVVDTGFGGTYFYFCQIYIKTQYTDFYYESAVTRIRVHEPVVNVIYSQDDVSLDIGQSASIKANVNIEPAKDVEGEYGITYQWYKGNNNIVGTYNAIKGATSDTLVITGTETAGKVYYACIVTFRSNEGIEFSNMSSDTPFVIVRNTGEKNAEIIQSPKDVKVIEKTSATFSVKALNAVKYEWYMVKPGGTSENPNKPIKLEAGVNGVVTAADKDTITIVTDLSYNGYYVYCLAYGANGKYVASNNALLEVIPDIKLPGQPGISEQPKSVTANVGDKVELKIQGTNTDGGTLVYRWYVSDTDNYPDIRAIDGAESRTYAPDNTAVGVKYYCCAVWNTLNGYEDGPVYSDFAKVEFKEAETAPEETTTGAAQTETDTETAASTESEAVTEPTQTESGVTTDTDKIKDPDNNKKTDNTLLIVLCIIICVLVTALIVIGIVVLVKSGKKKG